jgi:type I pantothenate kinase
VSDAGAHLTKLLRERAPRLIGLGGGVAAGKSTLAAQLAASLTPRQVTVVATDGFLLPTRELSARGILAKKGFPESYDAKKLVAFLTAIREGRPALAPLYSHTLYDPLPDSEGQLITAPDLVIVEGVNALQPEFLEFYDVSLYLDASEADQKRWYIERVHRVREDVRNNPDAYLHYLSQLSDDEFEARIERVWNETNLKNLREHIYPTRDSADLVLVKESNHTLQAVEELSLPLPSD